MTYSTCRNATKGGVMTVEQVLNLFNKDTYVKINNGGLHKIKDVLKQSDFVIYKYRKIAKPIEVCHEIDTRDYLEKHYIYIVVRQEGIC